MPDIVIQAENLSKLYHLGVIGTGSFRQDLKRWWVKNIEKKEDPFFKLGENGKQESRDLLWALNDVSFEIQQGEAFAIIGKNGA